MSEAQTTGDRLPPELRGIAPLLETLARRILELQHEHVPAAEPAGEGSPWMSLPTAARYLDWPRQRLYKLTAAGQIPHFKHDGRLLFHRGELDAWLARYAHGDRG